MVTWRGGMPNQQAKGASGPDRAGQRLPGAAYRIRPGKEILTGRTSNQSIPNNDEIPSGAKVSHHAIICPFMIARTYVYRAFEEAEADERYGEWQRRERQAALGFNRKSEAELQRLLVYREESPESLWLTKNPTLDLKKLIARDRPPLGNRGGCRTHWNAWRRRHSAAFGCSVF
jgi:hypothetical protein